MAKEDVWIPSSCGSCYCNCGILVHRVDGLVVKIEGNPQSPMGRGKNCAKGIAAVMLLYDPNRLNYPLKRTNPEKGIGVDPKWERISWDEALDIVTDKLKECKERDPRGLYFQATTTETSEIRFGVTGFMRAFGTNNYWVAGGGLHCGNGAHFAGGLMHASWSLVPDFAYCNYALYFGCSKGHGAGHVAVQNSIQAADARARGMKLIVFDPFLSSQASKAHEWIPIRVGTDGAVALAMVNVLLNELGMYDAEYLKKKTNAPYLIKPDGHYMRDKENGKPLIWDEAEGKAKTFDDSTVKEFALTGIYKIDGIECTTAFQLLKEHVKKYTPEKASEISTIPAKTIRRIAKEFGEEARIGSTIVIDGKELPYRPAAAIYFRGAQGHVNSGWTCLSIALLNQIVGCADTVGGAMGLGPATCFGHPQTGKPYFVPKASPDGLMIVANWAYDHVPYPPSEPKPPTRLDLTDLFSVPVYTPFMLMSNNEELWEKFKIPYRPDVMINFGCNSVMTQGNAQTVVENFLKKFNFIVSFNIFLTEFEDAVADIVLPDVSYFERLTPYANFPAVFNHSQGLGEWGWPIRQPVVEPQPERRDFTKVMMELADRLGIKGRMYEAINKLIPIRYGGELSPEYKFEPNGNYSWEEICDRLLKDRFGPEHGLEWFKEHGILTWPKKVEEVYWRPFLNVRVPIYFEHYIKIGELGRKISEQFGVPDVIDWSRYKGLPDWYPCPSHEEKSPEFDLYGFYWRPSVHANSMTMENPWLDEVAIKDPYVYTIQINAETARKKGLKDGDLVWLENPKGRRVKGHVKLTEGIHPEHIGIGACAGHWTPHQPIARGKGVFFNDLIEIDQEHTDPLTLNQDICVRVKIYKA